MQFQSECLFITPDVSGEDSWRLRCKIEYMSLEVPKFIVCSATLWNRHNFCSNVLTAAACTAATVKEFRPA
ncbi:hypothetical protein QL285_075718 [Trifolium repens]|nr:hypothetical protein QL285_075718 [Trifolium repens]